MAGPILTDPLQREAAETVKTRYVRSRYEPRRTPQQPFGTGRGRTVGPKIPQNRGNGNQHVSVEPSIGDRLRPPHGGQPALDALPGKRGATAGPAGDRFQFSGGGGGLLRRAPRSRRAPIDRPRLPPDWTVSAGPRQPAPCPCSRVPCRPRPVAGAPRRRILSA